MSAEVPTAFVDAVPRPEIFVLAIVPIPKVILPEVVIGEPESFGPVEVPDQAPEAPKTPAKKPNPEYKPESKSISQKHLEGSVSINWERQETGEYS